MNAFPAVHLKPLDWYDYVLRFSSELLVLILALGVAGLNLFHFYAGGEQPDQSFAAKFLSYHPDLNQKLYEKNNIITTQIVNSQGLVPLAQAEDFGLDPASADATDSPSDEGQNFAGDVLVQPNPDTLSSLIAKQIKVYQTLKGDSLASLAKANGISVQTIMWANKLEDEHIKPGWYLVILPTDGVLHKASANDTLPDIAKKYRGNLETIIAYNGLVNAEDIEPNQLVIVPGGVMPQTPKPKPPQKGKARPPANYVDNSGGHAFPWGYCTWYVAQKLGGKVKWGGNAKNWLVNARGYGAIIGNEPVAGAIVVTNDSRRFGHVAYIESVDERGFTVSEMNYEKFGKVNARWIPFGSGIIRGFIYP